MKEPKVLIYDIETNLLLGSLFSLGKQVFRHGQLLKGYFSRTHIICISYMWAHEKTVHVMDWGEGEDQEKDMIVKFDKLAQEADVIIGKNNFRFDDKHINTQRLWYDLPGMQDWKFKCDDLESHMRRTFYLPSQSLDYISEQLGLGGKDSMKFGDWTDIAHYRLTQLLPEMSSADKKALCEVLYNKSYRDIKRDGKVAVNKMKVYNKKDVTDTKNIWDHCKRHFVPKYNRSVGHPGMLCKRCGSDNILTSGGPKVSGKSMYQYYFCKDCNGSAGRALYNPVKNQVTGKMG